MTLLLFYHREQPEVCTEETQISHFLLSSFVVKTLCLFSYVFLQNRFVASIICYTKMGVEIMVQIPNSNEISVLLNVLVVVGDSFAEGRNVELDVDVFGVGVHGAVADTELVRNHFIAQSF